MLGISTQNSDGPAPAVSEDNGENNNMYYYTPNLASHLAGPAAASAESPAFFSLLNSSSDAASTRLAPSPSGPSPLMNSMMADGAPDISEFKMRAVMVFTYIGFAFLSIVLFSTFVISLYWTLSGSCGKSKQNGQQGVKKVQSSCCSIEDTPPPMVTLQQNGGGGIGVGSSTLSNGSHKKVKRKSSPKSSKYNETGLISDEESVNCELLEWDRQTQVIEMEDL